MNKDEVNRLIAMSIKRRTLYALAHGGISSIDQLINSSSDEILSIPNIGTKSLIEIKNSLAQFNLQLNGDA